MNSIYLKRGLLLLCAISSLSNSFAMELPENEKGKQKVVQMLSEIAEDEQCGVCYEDAKTLDKTKWRITQCCNKFICTNCADRIKADADKNADLTPEQRSTFANANHFDPIHISKAKCPFCRKPLNVKEIIIKKDYSNQKPITIIDKDSNQIVLSGQESAALLKCVAIANMIQDTGDYTINLSYLPEYTTLSLVKQLIACCDDIRAVSKDLNDANDIALFKLANFCDAPANIMHFFANRIWLNIQDTQSDNQEIKEDKKQLRLIAENYLANPGHLVAYARYHNVNLDAITRWGTMDLSYTTLASLLTANDGWYQGEDGLMYNAKFKFGSLKRFKEFVDHIVDHIGCSFSAGPINLSGHALIKCPLKEILTIFAGPFGITLILNNNLIQVLDADITGQDCENEAPLAHLIIKNNPITSIDDSFYNMAYQIRNRARNRGSAFELILQSDTLTEQQKKEARDKFYRITHTIPERLMTKKTLQNGGFVVVLAGIPVGVFVMSLAMNKLLNKLFPHAYGMHYKYFKIFMNGLAGLVGGAGSIPVSIASMWRILRLMTGVSHPEINQHFYEGQIWDSLTEPMIDPLHKIFAQKNFKISIE